MAMRCKYDTSHTDEFSNAVMLTKHYIAEHPDEYVAPVKQPCPLPDCGKLVSDVTQHLRKMHGIDKKGLGKGVVPVATEPAPVATPSWTADHIVLPVVTELAGGKKGAVPVGKLAAIFEWRDATQVMLDKVQ